MVVRVIAWLIIITLALAHARARPRAFAPGGSRAVGDAGEDHVESSLAPYQVLLRLLIDGRLTADEFETVFLRRSKHDETTWLPRVCAALRGYFRGRRRLPPRRRAASQVGGIDDAELRRRTERTLERLM